MSPEFRAWFALVRDLDWNGCVAVRDLGGLKTRDGVTATGIYVRSDNARNLTLPGWQRAWDYGIRTVLDLRSDAECENDPLVPAEFEFRRISLFAHFDENPAYRADLLSRVAGCDTSMAYRMLYSEALDLDRDRFVEAFGVLARSAPGILFHCVGGKDRTGVLAALLLRLAGVSMDEIEADYIHTEARARGRSESPHIDQSAPAGLISQVIAELEARHASVGHYLLWSGAPASDLGLIVGRLADGEIRS